MEITGTIEPGHQFIHQRLKELKSNEGRRTELLWRSCA